MDKAQALEFIGLKEPLQEGTLLQKYHERFHYYQLLYTHAPNKVVENIQQQNLEKLNQVKQILLEALAARKARFSPEAAPGPSQPATRPAVPPSIVAWLVLHTENRKAAAFPLQEGVNYIGRKIKNEGGHHIVIEDDPFISRTHAFIKCKKRGDQLHCELYDGDGTKASVNGVFLNGNTTRLHHPCRLAQNDTLQVGTTKLVFKIRKKQSSFTGEMQAVLKTAFIQTMQVDPPAPEGGR
jgi:hypothetical protein